MPSRRVTNLDECSTAVALRDAPILGLLSMTADSLLLKAFLRFSNLQRVFNGIAHGGELKPQFFDFLCTVNGFSIG